MPSRNDPRMQRGLAVARRMQEVTAPKRYVLLSERDRRIANRKAAEEHAAHEREILDLSARITPQDLAVLQQHADQGGMPAVERLLLGAGLSPGAVAVAMATAEARGGFDGLRAAVGERLQWERGEAVSAEIARYARVATAADGERITALYQQGGPEAVARALMSEAGLSRAAAEAAYREMQAGGLEGLRRKVVGRLEHEAAQEKARAAEAQQSQAEPEAAPESAEPQSATRKALEAVYDKAEGSQPRRAVDVNGLEDAGVPAGATEFTIDSARKAALVAAYAKQTGETIEATYTPEGAADTVRVVERGRQERAAAERSTRGVLERAYDAIASGSESPRSAEPAEARASAPREVPGEAGRRAMGQFFDEHMSDDAPSSDGAQEGGQ